MFSFTADVETLYRALICSTRSKGSKYVVRHFSSFIDNLYNAAHSLVHSPVCLLFKHREVILSLHRHLLIEKGPFTR